MLFAVSLGEFFLLVLCILMVVVFPSVVAWIARRDGEDR
jgi:hypothetical protein